MSYTALYRKFRPKNFDEVIGQNHIIKTLINQFETNTINHAYLFCGTRGTGKTSTAKIFAKLLNCENPNGYKPCGKCEICTSFEKNRSMNIFEIDAASNNSVDDIRELKEEIKYPPTKGKYKIYIIDEVHMLSIGAFNALLKTLEEPPEYIIFILATTDPQKIPVTILSRCQRFDFKRISNTDMIFAIKQNLKGENIDIEDDALKYIANISDGAMRDAFSLLEQCKSFYYDEKITLEKVLDILGSVDDKVFFDLTDAIIDFNSLECINIINEVILNGRDIPNFINEIIKHFRNLLIAGVSNANILDTTNEKFEKLKIQFSKKDANYFINLINTFSEIQSKIKNSFDARIILESTCVRLCCAINQENLEEIKEKLIFLENKIEKTSTQTVYIQKDNKTEIENEKIQFRELEISKDFQLVIDNWTKFIESLSDGMIKQFLIKSVPKNLEDEFLYIVLEKDVAYSYLEKRKDVIENYLYEFFQNKYKVYFIIKEDFFNKYKKVATTQKNNQNTNITEIAKNILPEGSFEIE